MIPTIHAAAAAIRAGWPTPVELLDECLANIDRYEDRVHAWVFVDRDGARAAAQACGMCLGALGSQTGGSITRPTAYCGVAGCKPTYGRVSCAGVVPLAYSMDHPGPMARCVHDLAVLLRAIAGPDVSDAACS